MAWIGQEQALTPTKPFFMYFAPGATHAPHHVPKEWADKYAGKFDHGWDVQREQTFARQKELGIIGPDAELTPWHDVIPAWEDMPEDMKPILTRQMENYAGFLEHTDHHIGRLIDSLFEQGILDNTLVYLIIGDNGASAEGTLNGTFNELISLNGMANLETPEFLRDHLDQLGGPESSPHYAVGWAHAMCAPYQWTKQVASHWGGTRNGTIVHWPNGIGAKGELRHQFTHVIDVAQTVLEAAGIPEPTQMHGITQQPMQGYSMVFVELPDVVIELDADVTGGLPRGPVLGHRRPAFVVDATVAEHLEVLSLVALRCIGVVEADGPSGTTYPRRIRKS